MFACRRSTACRLVTGFAIVLVLALPPARAADGAPALPPEVAATLKRIGLPARGFSAYVQVIGEPAPRLAYQADVPRNPASTIKVLTTLAALEVLGPTYTWKTEAYAAAPVRDTTLEGDLYLKGYGDPFLVIEHFWRFVRELRTDGLDTINGNLILDQSHFAPEPEHPADFDGRATRAYNVLPAALLVNFQAVRFRLSPQPHVGRVRVIAEPHPTTLEVVNRVQLARERCRDGLRGVGLQLQPGGGRERVVVSGRYEESCGEQEIFRVVSDPTRYIHGVFQALWREQGGRFDGGVREAGVPAQARLLQVSHSPPLSDIVRSINKYSNNVMTRQLLLTLGARESAPGTEAKGISEIKSWLALHGLNFPELALDNGSGLSREERISAAHLAEVLRVGYTSPFMPEFMSSLPISAMDGTLRRRFGGTPLEGRLHLKTGSLDGVRTMAGYLLDARGRRLVVVSLHNDSRLHTAGGEQVQQALLNWAYRLP